MTFNRVIAAVVITTLLAAIILRGQSGEPVLGKRSPGWMVQPIESSR